MRNLIFVSEHRVEFTSNGRRVQRLVTDREAEMLRKLIDDGDEDGIDSFCYRIV